MYEPRVTEHDVARIADQFHHTQVHAIDRAVSGHVSRYAPCGRTAITVRLASMDIGELRAELVNLWQADPAMGDLEFVDGARVLQPANDGQQLDRLVWLRELEPGQLAASDLNPLVGVE